MSGAIVTKSSVDTTPPESAAITTTTTTLPAHSSVANKVGQSQPFQPNEPLPDSNSSFIGNNAAVVGQIPSTSTPTNADGSNGDGNTPNGLGLGLGITLMQSSPPPHSYRHSRAYRHFKNPPQPHMCIRTTTDGGEELFINVLSWTRIVIPQEPSDPIPLYGGMRVPPGSPRSPPIVFAVMANPEVLKDSGRHSKDPEERRAMVELMCDFVEAMNPGVKLVRNAVILKDRDISGELKDVWNAVQAQRDREREEQIMQQRQQQHFHNVATQQMIPKTAAIDIGNTAAGSAQGDEQPPSSPEIQERDSIGSDSVGQLTGTTKTSGTSATIVTLGATINLTQNLDNKTNDSERRGENNNSSIKTAGSMGGAAPLNGDHHGVISSMPNGQIRSNSVFQNQQQNGNCDQLDASTKEKSLKSSKDEVKAISANSSRGEKPQQLQQTAANIANDKATKTPTSPTASSGGVGSSIKSHTKSTASPAVSTAPASTKKEKLGGFLPNGCIFPRFKNNKNKDKDKDKDKESKPKEKEKTLLNALKKNKDKKVAPIERHSSGKNGTNTTTTTTTTSPSEMETKSQYEKNCLNLESEVEKLDLNKIETSTSNENMFIKLKVAK